MNNDKTTRANPASSTSAASCPKQAHAPTGWRKVLEAALTDHKQQRDVAAALAAHLNGQLPTEDFIRGIEYAIRTLSDMKQPQPDLEEMACAFESSEFYFRGESPVQRAEAWAVWRASWNAALPFRLTPAFETELQTIAQSVAREHGDALTPEQALAVHLSFRDALNQLGLTIKRKSR